MTMANSIDELLFDITPENFAACENCVKKAMQLEKELYTEYQVKKRSA